MISKTLKSAIANAENNANLRVDRTRREGSDRGRRPDDEALDAKGARQREPIRKRTSHIRIILTDEIEIKKRERKAKRTGGGKKKKAAAAKATKAQQSRDSGRGKGSEHREIRKLIHGTES